MIRLEFGSGNLTKEIRINPRRSWMKLLARTRSMFSKGPFTLRGRSGEESDWYLQQFYKLLKAGLIQEVENGENCQTDLCQSG